MIANPGKLPSTCSIDVVDADLLQIILNVSRVVAVLIFDAPLSPGRCWPSYEDLQALHSSKSGFLSPLQRVQVLCSAHGPPLSVGQQLRRNCKPENVSSFLAVRFSGFVVFGLAFDLEFWLGGLSSGMFKITKRI
jgi:hypothetical protein